MRPANRSWGLSAGFTLIELLVVVAIIALLLSILLPSLRSARDQAKAVHCGAQIRGFSAGLAAYNSEYNDWIPGVNTSGVALSVLNASQVEEMQDPLLPLQHFDWMTPLIRYETNLPSRRAEKWATLFDRYRCVAHKAFNSQPYEGGNAPDMAEFLEIPTWSPISYLMPGSFQLWGRDSLGKILAKGTTGGMFAQPVVAKVYPDNWTMKLPGGYQSRIERVGTPAGKVFIADGTRFMDGNGIVDHDVSPEPGTYGAFTTSGAWWASSRAYGVARGGPNWDGDPYVTHPSYDLDGENLPLSYRHGAHGRGTGAAQGNKGTINILFFDGHVQRMQDQQSRRIDMWYPKGTTINIAAERIQMTTVEPDYVVR